MNMIVFDFGPVALIATLLEKMKIKRLPLSFDQRYCSVSLTSLSIIFFLVFSSLDPEQKDYLIEVIEKLLKDKTTVRIFNHHFMSG